MAASRTPSVPTAEDIATRTASRRVSFAKISEPLQAPDLLGLQTDSFDWLLGNPAWRDRVAAAVESGDRNVPQTSGLEEIFAEISPIEDFGQSMSLSFNDHRFEPAKYTPEECKEKDFTYAAPLFVTAEFTNYETGEIKSQTVFMGDFPLMTERVDGECIAEASRERTHLDRTYGRGLLLRHAAAQRCESSSSTTSAGTPGFSMSAPSPVIWTRSAYTSFTRSSSVCTLRGVNSASLAM